VSLRQPGEGEKTYAPCRKDTVNYDPKVRDGAPVCNDCYAILTASNWNINKKKTPKTREPRPTHCPKCGSPEVFEIVYGMPRAPRIGERFHYAGCGVVIGVPKWHCDACTYE